MSRAFITERDGWNFCRTRKMECSDAALDGSCERDFCKYGAELPKTEQDPKSVQQPKQQ